MVRTRTNSPKKAAEIARRGLSCFATDLLRRKLGLLFTLYFCQGLPGGFLAVVLPVVLRERGMSLTTIGLASFLSLPWVLKVLWAPLVDRYASARIGRRKSWILPAQAGMLAVTVTFMVVEPEHSLLLVVVLFAVLNLFAATQDIAVDGLAVDMLQEGEMGPGNAAQVAGFKLGNLFGGGVLLALSGWIGWRGDFAIMSACILGAMLVLWRTPEQSVTQATWSAGASTPAVLRRLWQVMKGHGLGLWLLLFYAKFGETFGGAMVRPMLVDHGFAREQIGIIDGIFGAAFTIAGAALAGVLSRKHGWWGVVAMFSALQGLMLLAIGVYQTGEITMVGITVLNGIENFAGGGVGVGVFALAMSLCDRDVGATQFTAAQVVYMSGAAVAAPLSGAVADASGYLPVMAAGGLMALTLAVLAPTWARSRWRTDRGDSRGATT
jgi:MFS transporter, PAT family, beta-lactamase induction signal transducer AmpG